MRGLGRSYLARYQENNKRNGVYNDTEPKEKPHQEYQEVCNPQVRWTRALRGNRRRCQGKQCRYQCNHGKPYSCASAAAAVIALQLSYSATLL